LRHAVKGHLTIGAGRHCGLGVFCSIEGRLSICEENLNDFGVSVMLLSLLRVESQSEAADQRRCYSLSSAGFSVHDPGRLKDASSKNEAA
jgi:hypothetical protein